MSEPTGSEQLLQAADKIDEARLGELVERGEKFGKIVDWCQYGQPAIDEFCGTIRVKPGRVGRLIDQLLDLHEIRINLDVFPLGKPGIDQVLVNVRNRH